MAKLVASAAVALTVLAQVTAAHDHHHHHGHHLREDFEKCLCWNTTTNAFCNGPEWYDADICHRLAHHALGFLPVAGVGALLLMAFPIIFYIARWCCRCCGGRHATRGCCCSDVSTRPTFPGYKNKTIACVKTAFWLVFIACIPVSIVLLSKNPNLHKYMLSSIHATGSAVDTLQANLTASAAATTALATDGSLTAVGLAPATLAEAATGMSAGWNKYVGTFHDVLRHVERAESNGWFGRNAITYIVPVSGLLILVSTALLVLTNQRQLVGMMMVAMCFHSATTVMIQTPQHVAAVAAGLVCDTYDVVAMPIVKGQAQINGLCGNAAVDAGLETLKTRSMAHVTEARSSFCEDYKLACPASGACSETPCDDAATYPGNGARRVRLSEDPLLATRKIDALLAALAPAAKDSSIPANARAAAERLQAFRTTTVPHLLTAFGTLYFINHDCGAIADAMRGPIAENVCGDNMLAGHLQSVSGLLCALITLGAVCALVMVFGMKRFRAWNSYNMLRGAEANDEAAPIMRGAPDTLVVVAAIHDGNHGALNDESVSGVVVEKEVAYVPSTPTSYGAAEATQYRKV